MRKLTIAGAAVATLAALLLPAAAHAAPVTPAAPAGHPGGLVVRTDRGLVKGKAAEGTHQWLGIPYAAPPTGARRWAAPQPAPRWSGVRPATSYGGRCAQLASGNGPRVDNENCLYLNVYAPTGASPAAPGACHDPRRRADHRRRRPARRVADREHRRHHRRLHQLPARPVRLPGRAWPRHLGEDRERQLRAARPGGRAAVGAPQHRRLRREPGRGHHRRRVGGRLVDVRADDLAAGPGPVPRRDHAERQLRHPDPCHRADGEPGVRQGGRLPGPGYRGGLPAPGCRSRRCSTPAPATSRCSPPAAPSCRCPPPRRSRPATTTGCR